MIGTRLRKRVRRAPLIVTACLSVLAGVALAHGHQLQIAWWLVLVPFGVLGWRRHDGATLIIVVCCCFGLGWWRGSQMVQQLQPYQHLALQTVTIVGQASEDGVYGERSQLVFGLTHLRVVQPYAAELPGNITVKGFGAAAVYRGDTVQAVGKLYPTRGNSQASVSFAAIQVQERHGSAIDTLRRKFAAGMQSALPEPLASFGLGLLIGQRNTLPDDVSHTLLAAGLTHIIAVSGYNLTIIVEAARRLFGKRSKFQTAATCLFLITFFLLITGSSPSIVRASIISVLSIAAWYYGRTVKPLVLLLTAATLSVVANPLYVWGNVSWYLSFLAFFGVLVLAPLLTKRILGNQQPRLLVQIALESLCAEIMVLPYILYIFGQMSLVGLVTNVLVVALIPLAMVLCVLAGLAGMLLPALAGWFAWPATFLLTYMLDVAGLLSRLPFALLTHIGFSLVMLLLWYAIVGWMIVLLGRNVARKYAIVTDKTAVQGKEFEHVRTLEMVDN